MFSQSTCSMTEAVTGVSNVAQHYADRMVAKGRCARQLIRQFAACDRGQQRFANIRQLMEGLGLLNDPATTPDVLNQLYKNGFSELTRTEGNEQYAAGRYVEAVVLYNQSLLTAKPGTKDHAIAFANRAAALYRLGEYASCLDDVRQARRSGYPAELAYKLSERAGDAARMLGRGGRAYREYAECLQQLDAVSETAEAAIRARVEHSLALCDGLDDGEEEEEEESEMAAAAAAKPQWSDLELLRDGANATIPAVSECLELKWSPEMGRGLYATRDICPGDTVFIDKPYIGCSTVFGTSCHYTECLKTLFVGIPCTKCKVVFYCNDVCLQKDSLGTHRFECPIIYPVKKLPGGVSKELVLKWFFHECNQMGVEMYCSVVENLMKTKMDPLTKGFDENGQFKSNSFLAAFCLENNERDITTDGSFFLHCIAVELLHYITSSGFSIPRNRIDTVGASIVHMFIVLELNCHILGLCDIIPKCDEIDTSALSLSYALYPSMCLFNHSCDPNIRRSGPFNDRTKVLKATQYISKGDQLFISYGPYFRGFDKTTRQQYFSSLNFECACKPCLENWPSGKCIPDHLSSMNILKQEMAETVMAECKRFKEFQGNVNPQDYDKHLNYLYSFIDFMRKNVKRPFKLYEECVSMITHAHISLTSNEEKFSSAIDLFVLDPK